MSGQLDLDDVASTSELAKKQLADLRAEVTTPILVQLNRLVDKCANLQAENQRLREAIEAAKARAALDGE